eukprot:gnl/TRDRNA2_/TRDRNA2_152912_c0_seq1.p1 gnl/TRDRNA2_/TRDRNA2_152912_c0~~gnl/TRDRNA2_/TRDRNA2_152912_c0_seq1.p1  ORF type:complete len:402 (+),score=94.57 gnl/TRDRNA2_/TRDRNA2_152912_c0_seq1:254-1459(+)
MAAAAEQKALESLSDSIGHLVRQHLQKRKASLQLQPAVRGGDVEKISCLLNGSADPNIPDEAGETVLFDAVAAGSLDTVALLLLHGADVAHKSMSNTVAADFAADASTKTLLKMFEGKEIGAAAKQKVKEALDASRWEQVLQRLDAKKPQSSIQKDDVPRPGEAPLFPAVRTNDLQAVQRLLKAGANPNMEDDDGLPPLFEAVARGHTNIIAALCLNGANANFRSIAGKTASDTAADDSSRALLTLFQQPSPEGEVEQNILRPLDDSLYKSAVKFLRARRRNSELIPAVRNGDVQQMLSLLQHGVDANTLDENGEPVLFEALSSGNVDAVAVLLLHRADQNQRSRDGTLAADVAGDFATRTLLKLFQGKEVAPAVEEKALSALSTSVRGTVEEHLRKPKVR